MEAGSEGQTPSGEPDAQTNSESLSTTLAVPKSFPDTPPTAGRSRELVPERTRSWIAEEVGREEDDGGAEDEEGGRAVAEERGSVSFPPPATAAPATLLAPAPIVLPLPLALLDPGCCCCCCCCCCSAGAGGAVVIENWEHASVAT